MFGTACTPETPIGTCMVSSEGACAAYYNFGRFSRERRVRDGRPCSRTRWRGDDLTTPEKAALGRGRGRRPTPASEHLRTEEQVLERIERARRRRPRVREERITLAHGAGGKATQTLIEAVFLDAFRNPDARAARRRGAV